MDKPSGQKMGSTSAGGMRRLSSIAEQVSDNRPLDTAPRSHKAREGSEWPGSSFSMCSDKVKNSSSHYSSDDSHQTDTGGTRPHGLDTSYHILYVYIHYLIRFLHNGTKLSASLV